APRSVSTFIVVALAQGTRLQMRGQLDALRLSSGESCRGLSKAQISQAHFFQDPQLVGDFGRGGEKLQRLANGQIQRLMDIFSAILYIQGLGLVTRSMALFADQFHVSEKLH